MRQCILLRDSLLPVGNAKILWDGKTDGSIYVNPARYTYKIWLIDRAGNTAGTYPVTGTTTVMK